MRASLILYGILPALSGSISDINGKGKVLIMSDPKRKKSTGKKVAAIIILLVIVLAGAVFQQYRLTANR